YPVLGWLLFLSAFVLAGIPPFGGFIGKVLLLKGALTNDEVVIVIIGLLTSLLILYSVMQIFIKGFWGAKDQVQHVPKKSLKGWTAPIVLLLTFAVFLGVAAEFTYPAIDTISKPPLLPLIYV